MKIIKRVLLHAIYFIVLTTTPLIVMAQLNAQESIDDVIITPVQCLVDVSCEICGKIMEKEIDCPQYDQFVWYGDADLTTVWYMDDYYNDILTSIDVKKSIEVCGECDGKYGSKFRDGLTDSWDALLKDFRAENAGLREYYEGKKADHKILTEIQNQLNKIQNQIDKLQ